ncbi:MAG: SafA/ExsA family spore coat assembly protein [Clostridia bacterium]|jgi:uncharacterized YkwD family protein/spore coat assembly protein SafA|nr:SafA/ExsA family spore coat assembly protein [Clostridiaceae bacterium]
MKYRIRIMIAVALLIVMIPVAAYAQTTKYTVVKGDSLWKIAVKFQVGLSEIISANPQFKNPNLIYPGDIVYVPQQTKYTSEVNEVIRLVNVERQKNGLKPLTSNWELSRVAQYKSQDMANKGYFSHQSPTYGSPFDMMRNFGIRYSSAGENIAYGYSTPAQVMNGWMNSPGHRANILNASFTQIGVGIATNSKGTKYWTQMFIRP